MILTDADLILRREQREHGHTSHYEDDCLDTIAYLQSRLAQAEEQTKLEVTADLVESIHAAVAQGWCVPPNTSKPMDVDLALAIVNNVLAELRRATAGKEPTNAR